MLDGGNFTPEQVVALLASHTVARSDHIDPDIKAAPFDSTPFTFDTQVFVEVLLEGTGFPSSPNNTGMYYTISNLVYIFNIAFR
jgi:hypothetical protein